MLNVEPERAFEYFREADIDAVSQPLADGLIPGVSGEAGGCSTVASASSSGVCNHHDMPALYKCTASAQS